MPDPGLLRDCLAIAVPMQIAALAAMEPWLRAATIEEWRSAAVEPIACRGDVLMFGGGKNTGGPADVFNHLAKGLAVLAHAPGGVRFAGLHFDADPAATRAALAATDDTVPG